MKKNTPNTNETTDNLVAAFSALQPMPLIEFEYRVYYDPITRECTIKTIDKPEGKFVVVTREQYEAVEFCPNYYISSVGEIEKKKFDFTPKKLLQSNEAGKYKTIKDDNVFRVDDAYLEDTDCWSLKDFDGY